MKLRMQITKDPEIRFISHLEYVRTIGRAIRRAKLPAAYSEGFNPHLKFSLASALGVGVVSYTEFVEIELAEPMDVETAAKALDKALPRGIRVLAADAVDTHHAALMSQAAGASYRVTLPYNKDITAAVEAFNAAEQLLFKKAAPKTKAGFKEIDVKFYIPRIAAVCNGEETVFSFDCKITPTGSMKAVDLLNALNEQYALGLPVEMADIERLRLYKAGKNGKQLPMLDAGAVKLA
ncbi:TIGR03936 family radical SAM-associated protein [Phascolarctobacterium sp.]|uniref:TIGR03936 family radical SAM-associated protein n=1 Tax=Phascolarctobacterium sp. TaxID=2049039 RepID=UPI003870E1B3